MKIIVTKESVLKILSIAESIISTKNSISILSNVLLKAANSSLVITARETSLDFISEINVEVIEDGSVSVYCNRLFTLIRKLSCSEIMISSDSENIVTITPKENNKCEYKLKGIDSNKFPTTKVFDELQFFSLSQDIFSEMVKKLYLQYLQAIVGNLLTVYFLKKQMKT